MNKQTISLALAVTAIVFTIGNLVLRLGTPTEPQTGPDLSYKLDEVENQLDGLRTQLERLEKEKRTPVAGKSSQAGAGSREEGEPTSPEEGEESREVASWGNQEDLATRVSALRTRIEA